jgi:hypothetical protein
MTKYDHIIKCSGGNDSVALIRWAWEQKLENVVVLHNDTGWASEAWPVRMETIVKPLAARYCMNWVTLQSVGMEKLVSRRRRGWPSRLSQFCTIELKIEPYLAWLKANWPSAKEATVYCGVRRAESEKRRTWPEYVESSNYDLGLALHSPLALMSDEQRNELLHRAYVEPLPHRSRECCPCINSNKADILALPERDIAKVERIENKLGRNGKGNLCVMFRAKKHKGALGIRNIIKWAKGEEFQNDELDTPLLCDAGMCGD